MVLTQPVIFIGYARGQVTSDERVSPSPLVRKLHFYLTIDASGRPTPYLRQLPLSLPQETHGRCVSCSVLGVLGL